MILTCGALSVTMPNGTVSDTRDITTKSISLQNSAFIAQYRDSWWPVTDLRSFGWTSLSEAQVTAYQNFILATLGQPIVVTEYRTGETLTVLHVPETIEVVRTSNSCKNSISTVFMVLTSLDTDRYYLSLRGDYGYLTLRSGVELEATHS